MKKYLTKLIIVLTMMAPLGVAGQVVAVKSNALYWATTTPNLGVETAISPKISLELSGGLNKWDFGSTDNFKKLNHFLIGVESRYWFEEAFDGSFLGFHGFFGSYNAGGINIPIGYLSNLKNSRYEGYAVGAGFSYGYQWYLGPHWNLELTAGLGYAYLNYDRFECDHCGSKYGHGTKHYVGVTKVGVSFIYLIKPRKVLPSTRK